jgi:hypothetical protein
MNDDTKSVIESYIRKVYDGHISFNELEYWTNRFKSEVASFETYNELYDELINYFKNLERSKKIKNILNE